MYEERRGANGGCLMQLITEHQSLVVCSELVSGKNPSFNEAASFKLGKGRF